jgi:hypothetical protein
MTNKIESSDGNNTLNAREQQLRIEELQLRVKALKKPEYAKISTWTGLVAIFVAVSGIIAQGILYQIKSAKAENELNSLISRKDAASLEIKLLSRTRDSLKLERAKFEKDIEKMSDVATNDSLSAEQKLKAIKEGLNATAIDLQPSTSGAAGKPAAPKSLNTAIEELFAPKAAVRGAAYNTLMTYYSTSPELLPSLLKYAGDHQDNQNGIYNTLVILGHLDYSKVPDNTEAVRSFAKQTAGNGPRSAERAEKVLKRLPND